MGDLVVAHAVPLGWENLGEGVEAAFLRFVRQSSGERAELAAVRIDPRRCRFRLLSAPELIGQPAASVPEMRRRSAALLAVNANFYLTENFKPIGLAVSEGEVKNPWKRGAGSGIFAVQDGRAVIEWARHFQSWWTEAEAAVQAGPLLIEPEGEEGIYADMEKRRARTAVGVTADGRVVLVCTLRQAEKGEELSGLDLYELMQILKLETEKGGLGLRAALNLDGGTSTSLSLAHPRLQLEIPSVLPVPTALAVFPR